MLTFRTSPPSHYIPPTTEEMRVVANRVELKSFSRDLVADLCNLAAGGTINPPSAYREVVRELVERKLPAPDSQGFWEYKARDGKTQRTDSRQQAIDGKTAESLRYHRAVADFLGSVDLTQFPGSTPLEQAMSLLKLLSKQQGGNGGGEGGEPLPIFQENDNPEKEAANLHNLMDQVDSLSEEEQEMLDPEGETRDESKDGERSGDKGLSALKVAEKLSDPNKERLMLEISRKLEQITKLQVRRQRKLVADPAGEERRMRPIESVSELPKLTSTGWATATLDEDLFWMKVVRGELDVREKVTRQEKKQAVFILLDGSGSMKGRKHWKASGVVMHFLKAAAKGDCVVWLSVFDTKLGKVDTATTPEEARAMIKKFMAGNYSGGGTDIAAAVRSAHTFMAEKIKAGEALYRPEIVVLTDEDTSISSLKTSEIKGTRVHGFAMEQKNPALVKVARATGGIGFEDF